MTATTPPTAISESEPQTSIKSVTLSLQEMLGDGMHLVLLLQNGSLPNAVGELNKRMEDFLTRFEKNACLHNKPQEAIAESKYAFCALFDEVIMFRQGAAQPSQFGAHARTVFFEKLQALHGNLSVNIEAVEVFHRCLLLGFQGKYRQEGQEKRSELISRLQQDITAARGGKADLAPHWKLPQRFQPVIIRPEMPLWLFSLLLVAVGAIIFIAYFLLLNKASVPVVTLF